MRALGFVGGWCVSARGCVRQQGRSWKTPSGLESRSFALCAAEGRRRRRGRGWGAVSSVVPRWTSSSSSSAAAASAWGGATAQKDTVYAVSSGLGRAGVAVVRVSGPDAGTCVQTLCPGRANPPPARLASLRRLFHPTDGELVDEALVLFFPAPRSFTGEDVAELHVHGSQAVLQSLLSALAAVTPASGTRIRPAEKGEFTRRAFENGKMDLTEVEGLADLIASETTEQRRQALRQIGGDLRRAYETWREELKSCLAFAEAVIDFGEDVDDSALDSVLPKARKLRDEMRRALADGRRGEIIRSGVRIAILGAPNAGKSSLLNCLAKRPAAIVSPIAGTTRDIVQVSLDLAGMAVSVSDTAGLRENTDDPIELEGIRRAWLAKEEAHLSVYLVDVSDEDLHLQWITPTRDDDKILFVANKIDSRKEANREHLLAELGHQQVHWISCKTGEGINELIDDMERRLRKDFELGEEVTLPLVTRERHRFHLEACVEALEAFLNGLEATGSSLPLDIATEELRIATAEIGNITGAIQVEEVLDVVFQEFCIGK